MKNFRAFLKNNKGATAIEYGLIAALIAVASIAAMQNLGSELRNTFATTAAKLQTSTTSAGNGTAR